ncbi:MAG: class I SAM-dependent methyltransferase [Proteobacteria bacterium]|nr:class I SAM-dependent methyltransferase [Pseudomonadota bacterium]MBI3497421.1 class I SAM-dependent methyltransferase [Pseudomonadota bacterium]
MLAGILFSRLIQVGSLTVIDSAGHSHRYGTGEPHIVMRLHDRRLHTRFLLQPSLALGEGYMDGTLTVENASLYDLVDLLAQNIMLAEQLPITKFVRKLGYAVRFLHQRNPIQLARKHVAHHYDLSIDLYRMFLDTDLQYSCAYFPEPTMSLDQAQRAKQALIASKLLLAPGQRVLDIGSGWGGLALYLARQHGVDVTGLTLSKEQAKVATERARQAGLADRVRFHVRDYREETGCYDRIVSVGMFEHVGVRHYGEYFASMKTLLAENGVALLHTIGRTDIPGSTNPWLRKYIFPGGYSPALSEISGAIEPTGLIVADIEILRLHYATTLAHWRQRFEANRSRAAALFDERFCRMWEFYLVGSELAFRRMAMVVFQLQIVRDQTAVPLVRDYLWENRPSLPADVPPLQSVGE